MVPKGSEDLGGGRYSSGGYEDIDGILKFYRKVYGSDGKNYKLRRLFVLRHVSAYHLRSLNSSSGWSGINVAFYRNRRQLPPSNLCDLPKLRITADHTPNHRPRNDFAAVFGL